MLMRKDKGFFLFAFDLAHVKYGIDPGLRMRAGNKWIYKFTFEFHNYFLELLSKQSGLKLSAINARSKYEISCHSSVSSKNAVFVIFMYNIQTSSVFFVFENIRCE